MAWVYLDDQFPDHPKVALAGGDAAWLFVCGLAYVKRYATPGIIPKGQVPKLSDRKGASRLAKRLVEVGLWEDAGEHYRVHDYDDWNKPQASRSESARKAAKARWNRQANGANAHAPPDADAHADALPDASESQCEADADTDASGCPPPLPPAEEPTSSNGLTTRAETPDDDDPSPPGQTRPDTPPDQRQRIGTALAILADRALAARQAVPGLEPIGDAVAWTNEAIDRHQATDGDRLAQLADEHPSATPEQLADLLEPPPSTNGRHPEPERTTANGQPFMPGIGPLTGPPELPEPDPFVVPDFDAMRLDVRQPHRPRPGETR